MITHRLHERQPRRLPSVFAAVVPYIVLLAVVEGAYHGGALAGTAALPLVMAASAGLALALGGSVIRRMALRDRADAWIAHAHGERAADELVDQRCRELTRRS